jgi:Type IV secretion system pilin
MNKLKLFYSSAVVFLMPLAFASAQGLVKNDTTELSNIGNALRTLIETVLVPLVIAIAFLVFIWGIFLYFIAGGSNDDSKAKGKSLMIYATLGFFFILAIWGIVNLLVDITGVGNETYTGPNLPEFGGGGGDGGDGG